MRIGVAACLLFWVTTQRAAAGPVAELDRELTQMCERAQSWVVPLSFGPKAAPGRDGIVRSGTLLRPGYVVTVAPGLPAAESICILRPDGKRHEVALVGVDEHTNLGVLRADGLGQAAAKCGQSEGLKLGSVVLAVGAPDGAGHSASLGVVSSTRAKSEAAGYPFVQPIQMTTPIRPGDSGGALLNARGEVVGLLVAAHPRATRALEAGRRYGTSVRPPPSTDRSRHYSTGADARPAVLGAPALNFAIPIEAALSIAAQLIEKGYVDRGWLGVVLSEDARPGAPPGRGAVVVEVPLDTPAAAAGIERADVILFFGGSPVNDANHLRRMVAANSAGANVDVRFLRNGKERRATVTLSPRRRPRPAGRPKGTRSAPRD